MIPLGEKRKASEISGSEPEMKEVAPTSPIISRIQEAATPCLAQKPNPECPSLRRDDPKTALKYLDDLNGINRNENDFARAAFELRNKLSPESILTTLKELNFSEEESLRLARLADYPTPSLDPKDAEKLRAHFDQVKQSLPSNPFLLPLAEQLLIHLAENQPQFVLDQWELLYPDQLSSLCKLFGKCTPSGLEKLFQYQTSLFTENVFSFGERLCDFPNWKEIIKKTLTLWESDDYYRYAFLTPRQRHVLSFWLKRLPQNERLCFHQHLIFTSDYPHFWNTLWIGRESDTPENIVIFLTIVSKYWPELVLREEQIETNLVGYLKSSDDPREQALCHHFFKTAPLPLEELIKKGRIGGKVANYDFILSHLAQNVDCCRELILANLEALLAWVINPKNCCYDPEDKIVVYMQLFHLLERALEGETVQLSLTFEEMFGNVSSAATLAVETLDDCFFCYLFALHLGKLLHVAPQLKKLVFLGSDTFSSEPAYKSAEFNQALAALKQHDLPQMEDAPPFIQEDQGYCFRYLVHFLVQCDRITLFANETMQAHLDRVIQMVYTERKHYVHFLQMLDDEVFLSSSKRLKDSGAQPYSYEYARDALFTTKKEDRELITWLVHPYYEAKPFKMGQHLCRIDENEVGRELIRSYTTVQCCELLNAEIEFQRWAYELMLEQICKDSEVFVNHKETLQETIPKLMLIIAELPYEYFTPSRSAYLSRWLFLTKEEARLSILKNLASTPLFSPFLQNFGFKDYQLQPNETLEQALRLAAAHWPTLKAPKGILPATREYKSLTQRIFEAQLFESTLDDLGESDTLLEKIIAGDHALLTCVAENRDVIENMQANPKLFLELFKALVNPIIRVPRGITLHYTTQAFKLFSRAADHSLNWNPVFIDQFQKCIKTYLTLFFHRPTHNRSIFALPFALCIGEIAQKAPQLLSSLPGKPALQFEAFQEYLTSREITHLADLEALQQAFMALRKVIPLQTENKLP